MVTRLPCYVVAEIPDPVRSAIQSIRDAFATPTATLPVEITLLGSSGGGPIPVGTAISFIEDQIERLFSEVSPWKVSFSEICAFPNTSTVYLVPSDRSHFDQVHRSLRGSALPSSLSPFPYNPHCTLRAGDTLTPDQLSYIFGQPFPKDIFKIDTVSVYDFDVEAVHCNLIYQKRLA